MAYNVGTIIEVDTTKHWEKERVIFEFPEDYDTFKLISGTAYAIIIEYDKHDPGKPYKIKFMDDIILKCASGSKTDGVCWVSKDEVVRKIKKNIPR